jgi:hypothetical protein
MYPHTALVRKIHRVGHAVWRRHEISIGRKVLLLLRGVRLCHRGNGHGGKVAITACLRGCLRSTVLSFRDILLLHITKS